MLRIQKNNIDKWKLLLKVLSDELPENDSYFQRWLNEDPANKSLYKSLKEGQGNNALFDKEQVFRNISNKLSLNTTRKTGWYRTKWFKYATSAVAIVTLFIIAIYHVTREPHLPEVVEKTIFDPGSKKAYLLSMEGEMTDLSQSFEVKKEDGTIISNKSEGVISFEKTASVKRKIEQQPIYVPKSGEYELLLSDGTRVYLNSESRLTFPSYFEGETRQVELQGEAYFEVKKGGKPFVILTPELTVEVLGTSFNINAYETNPYVNTTLVEGNVRVHLTESRKVFQLKPEQNLRLDKSSDEVSVERVNTDLYTAWVKGEFMFRNQPLPEIFAQLERWYDFKIVYENQDIKKMRFTGSAEKAKQLNYLLDLITDVTNIKYRYEGEKIILY